MCTRRSLVALALPPMPPDVRQELGDKGLALARVELLPDSMAHAAQREAGKET
jgi:hypothetical protein